MEALVTVAQALSAAQIPVDDLSLRQPTLDEVFLTITGSVPDDDLVPEEATPRAPPPLPPFLSQRPPVAPRRPA